jgi:hypothetical protein
MAVLLRITIGLWAMFIVSRGGCSHQLRTPYTASLF